MTIMRNMINDVRNKLCCTILKFTVNAMMDSSCIGKIQ